MRVAKLIISNLELQQPSCYVAVPERDNIQYLVYSSKQKDPVQTFSWLLDELKAMGSATQRVIVFCRNRDHVRLLYRLFDNVLGQQYKDYRSRPYEMYHSGTDQEIKEFVSKQFSIERGITRVLLATMAFGMGVNCRDLKTTVSFIMGHPMTWMTTFRRVVVQVVMANKAKPYLSPSPTPLAQGTFQRK